MHTAIRAVVALCLALLPGVVFGQTSADKAITTVRISGRVTGRFLLRFGELGRQEMMFP
jgi:hypothetical protein